ncbi:DNA polymerase III subunit delta [uncultured Capnocytophaga sp.]|jgi:DNA polymerase III, delta subunit|uniref:DNA polymerase III subunit delta n=1 Tax=uncultured Capnocytophaga sp. TaxID=159273 RepID=UPI002627C466|nr:DNA polymerase III subunit delta [uncultured Capnocytophaga sp.]
MNEVEKILAELEKKNYSPIYYLYGEEPFFIDVISDYIERNVLSDDEKAFNQQIVYGKDITIDALIHYAREYPMMAERRVIIVKEAKELNRTIANLEPYVKNPSPTTLLVICYKYGKIDGKTKLAKELNKYVSLESKKLYESDTLKWITKYLKDNNYTITQVANQLLVSFLGTDLGRIANELNKLKIILPKGTEITPSHIEENIGISKDFNVFELQNAIGKKEFPKAMQIIKYFNENQKDNAMPMITENLYQYFKKLFIYSSSIGKADAELAREMGINPFFLKDYKVAAMNYPLKKISFCMEVIKQTDLKSKGVESGSISYYDLLKELIVKIIF